MPQNREKADRLQRSSAMRAPDQQPGAARVTEPTGVVRGTHFHPEIDREISEFFRRFRVSSVQYHEFLRYLDWRWGQTSSQKEKEQ